MDVLSTMSDPSLPLTVIEFEEWGNPGADLVSGYGVKQKIEVRPRQTSHLRCAGVGGASLHLLLCCCLPSPHFFCMRACCRMRTATCSATRLLIMRQASATRTCCSQQVGDAPMRVCFRATAIACC